VTHGKEPGAPAIIHALLFDIELELVHSMTCHLLLLQLRSGFGVMCLLNEEKLNNM
jgi:hypothetical protein